MEEGLIYEGFAYETDTVKLFPLCVRNADGSRNKFESCMAIVEAGRTFGQKAAGIPSDKIAAVLSQLEGAAMSHGLKLEVTP